MQQEAAHKTADYIIVGGGQAGCVVASRLSQANRDARIVLIEAGPDKSNDPRVTSPTHGPQLHGTALEYNYHSTPQVHLQGRQIANYGGCMLSGSSGVNYGLWTRGAAADYDLWGQQVKDRRWSYAGQLKYFRRTETCCHPTEVPGQHGWNGPIRIGVNRGFPLRDGMRDAYVSVGLEQKLDANGGMPHGVAPWIENFHAGARQPAATAYGLGGVEVYANCAARRVVLADDAGGRKKVVKGVELVDGRYLMARHEVIVCCGALRTPQLLMLSGIGPAEDLRQIGVPQTVNAPAVGRNLHDHFSNIQFWKLRYPERVLADGYPGFDKPHYAHGLPFDWIATDSPSQDELRQSLEADNVAPEQREGYTDPRRVHFEMMAGYTILGSGSTEGRPPRDGTHISTAVLNLLPTSRGRVTISSDNPLTHPVIDPNYFGTETDQLVLRAGVRRMMQVMESAAGQTMVVGETPPPGWPALSSSSSDAEIDERLRATAASMYHTAGTASMGVVVDTDLRVFGVNGLRVVDASVFPLPLGAHYQAAVYALAEQAADIIANANRAGRPKL